MMMIKHLRLLLAAAGLGWRTWRASRESVGAALAGAGFLALPDREPRAALIGGDSAAMPVERALALVASRAFPAIKYALGHGRSCQRLSVASPLDVTNVRAASS